MFSFFKKKPKPAPEAEQQPVIQTLPTAAPDDTAPVTRDVTDRADYPPPAFPAPTPAPPVLQDTLPDSTQSATIPGDSSPDGADSGNGNNDDSDIDIDIVEAAIPAVQKQSWMARLRAGLNKTSGQLTTLFIGARIDDNLYEELESALLMADAGMAATTKLLTDLKMQVKDQRLTEPAQVRNALRNIMINQLQVLQRPLVLDRHAPLVMMIAGVNGAGKTTTIGKLAKHLQSHQRSVVLAAGDTFRAAAREQLMVWGERNNVTVIAQESGDPAAVAFDSVQSAIARKTNVVMIDTAGRLPTQLHLMDELKKIQRVIGKAMPSAPHEVLLVIDGNTGQNALAQVKAFNQALTLTGLIVTKLDGTAKGGVLAAIAATCPVPVYFIGVGEQIEDLQPFDATRFVDALLG